jgi:hypothetical protein
MDNLSIFDPILFFYNSKVSFKNFTILGERHSGTNWLEYLCKYNINIPITWEYGFKHFIPHNWNIYQASETTLFFCIVRDIYTWIPSFFKNPHNVHKDIAYNIDDFLSKEWSSVDIDTQKEIIEDRDYITLKKYRNIFHLREQKLKFYYHFLPYLVNNLIIIKYENLLRDPYELFELLHKSTSISINRSKNSFLDPKKPKEYILRPNIKNFIDNNTNWNVENLYNYKKTI